MQGNCKQGAKILQPKRHGIDQSKSVKGSDEVGSLVIRLLNEKTTRLGKIYEVIIFIALL